jgi:hypothetical protein
VVPEVDRDDRHAVILVDENGQAVVEDELLVGDLELLPIEGLRGRSGEGGRGDQKGGEECRLLHGPGF